MKIFHNCTISLPTFSAYLYLSSHPHPYLCCLTYVHTLDLIRSPSDSLPFITVPPQPTDLVFHQHVRLFHTMRSGCPISPQPLFSSSEPSSSTSLPCKWSILLFLHTFLLFLFFKLFTTNSRSCYSLIICGFQVSGTSLTRPSLQDIHGSHLCDLRHKRKLIPIPQDVRFPYFYPSNLFVMDV